MALFKVNNSWSYTPQMLDCAGQFVVPANATTPNQQVLPGLIPTGTPGVSTLTATSNISPLGCLFYFFCSPNASVAQPVNNPQRLPAGVVTTAQTAGSEFLIDASGFQSDIISATAGIITPGRGAQTLEATVSAIDNTNKLIYVQVVGFQNGTPTAATQGSIITFQVVMKDTFAV